MRSPSEFSGSTVAELSREVKSNKSNILLIVLTASHLAISSARSIDSKGNCKGHFAQLNLSRELIAARTNGVKWLNTYLTQLSKDSYVPMQVRKVLQDALVNHQTRVYPLTKRIQRELSLQDNTVATHNFSGLRIQNEQDGKFYLLFDKHIEQAALGQRRGPRLWVKKNLDENTSEYLVHELAHVRFMGFLDRTFLNLVTQGRLPQWAVYEAEGKFWLMNDFYSYLSERYAYETQLRFLKAYYLAHPEIKVSHSVFGDIRNTDDRTLQERLIAFLRKEYPETNDPRFRQFDAMPLSRILLELPN